MRTLLYSDSLKEWECATSVSTKINLWEKEAQESRAMNNFAKANGMQRSRVTLEKVKESDLGLEGWTTYDDKQQARGSGSGVVVASAVGAPAGNKKTRAAQKKAEHTRSSEPPSKATGTKAKANQEKALEKAHEKRVKQLIGTVEKSVDDVKKLKLGMETDPKLKWMEQFVVSIDQAQISFDTDMGKYSKFVEDLRVAFLREDTHELKTQVGSKEYWETLAALEVLTRTGY